MLPYVSSMGTLREKTRIDQNEYDVQIQEISRHQPLRVFAVLRSIQKSE